MARTGLLAPDDQNAQAAAGPAPDPKAPPQAAGQDDPEGAGNVSPEEQQAYDNFVGTALTLMADDKVTPGLVDLLKNGKPLEALATAAVNVVQRVEAAAKQKGQDIPGDILLHGGEEIVENLAELAGAAKVHTFTPEEISGAYYRAVDMYREQKQAQGGIDQNAAGQDLAEVKNAEAQGTLDQLLPGISQAANAKPGAPTEKAA